MSLRDELWWVPHPSSSGYAREPPIPPCPLPQSLNEIEGATNPACGARRNLRVTAVTVLDFFRPLRFPRFASSSPGSAKLVYPLSPPSISKEIEGGGAFFLPSPVGEGGPRRGFPKTRYEFLGVHGKRWMRRTPVSYLNCLLWRRERMGSPPSQRWGGASSPRPTRQKPQKSPVEINGGKAGG